MKHGQKKAYRYMTNDKLRDYYTLQLAIYQGMKLFAQDLQSDLLKHAVNFCVKNVTEAEAQLKKRGIDTALSHGLVLEAYTPELSDLSPETISEEELVRSEERARAALEAQAKPDDPFTPEFSQPIQMEITEFSNARHLNLVEGGSIGAGP